MVSSSTESEELFSPKSSAALGQMGVSLRNNNRRASQRPLTCYLPVFPDQGHFDLRVHIASCGHQLEMCATDVLVDTNSCRGYLYKLGSASRWWKKRWFVFDRSSRALMYFMDKTERKLKGKRTSASVRSSPNLRGLADDILFSIRKFSGFRILFS